MPRMPSTPYTVASTTVESWALSTLASIAAEEVEGGRGRAADVIIPVIAPGPEIAEDPGRKAAGGGTVRINARYGVISHAETC